MNLLAIALNRAELRVADILIPWCMLIGSLGFLAAWLVAAIMERTGLSRYVWNFPLLFLALAVLFGSAIGLICVP
jgi:hypothetical protein